MDLIPLFAFCITMIVTPGPNNLMLTTSGLNHGIIKTLPHWLGISLGFPFLVIAIGLGLGTVFQAYPIIHPFFKIGGASYLLYLAWKIATTPPPKINTSARKPFSFLEAALFQWINPKGWVMGIGAISTFARTEHITADTLIIASAYAVGACLCLGWVVLGQYVQTLIKNPKHITWLNRTLAALLALSIIPVLLTQIT